MLTAPPQHAAHATAHQIATACHTSLPGVLGAHHVMAPAPIQTHSPQPLADLAATAQGETSTAGHLPARHTLLPASHFTPDRPVMHQPTCASSPTRCSLPSPWHQVTNNCGLHQSNCSLQTLLTPSLNRSARASEMTTMLAYKRAPPTKHNIMPSPQELLPCVYCRHTCGAAVTTSNDLHMGLLAHGCCLHSLWGMDPPVAPGDGDGLSSPLLLAPASHTFDPLLGHP